MSKLMLIDATHPEETRVAVVANGQIEDFDFEAQDKRQLRGNIYLAKITRVEPSLQAAFVEYGGNRHGFLAFNEIHPDYYQIPSEDREALLAETAALDDEDGDEDDDDDGEGRRRQSPLQRKYKIQEVIKRRQVMLIQVVKEERGNKGAAVTTYLSLAGRYCVLMPNTARGGGISRKITNSADRKRLKKVVSELDVPKGMGLIVRTAGAKRTKSEIRRDYDYLTRLWDQIVSRTLESHAPSLIHEEGNLVLRAVRDLYDKDIEQIVVDGDDAYREARNFVKMLMPSHAKKVQQHVGSPPLFVSMGLEDQLETIFTSTVQLPSGGYIVINQTEALVAIDVNSGKSTRERNVEATAVRTNLEAAAEACRQMRLRDLAGLVVIDFIDMEDAKNNRAVERKMKDSLKIDRARVQTGRISQFGLFEISRQRRRAGVLELSSEHCAACDGSGRVRAVASAALQLLRAIEARASDERVDAISVQAPAEVALYILNEKRGAIAAIEGPLNVTIRIEAALHMKAGEFAIEATSDGTPVAYKPIKPADAVRALPKPLPSDDDDIEEEEDEDDDEIIDEDESDADRDDDDATDADADEDAEQEAPRRRQRAQEADDAPAGEDEDEASARRRRRGRRGGRRRRNREAGPSAQPAAPGLEVIEPEDDEMESGSDGRRRRRRNRPRRRAPDIATDGGELLDAIAAAPFLIAPLESDQAETGADADATPVAAAREDAPAHEAAAQPVASHAADQEPAVAAEPSVDTDGSDTTAEPTVSLPASMTTTAFGHEMASSAADADNQQDSPGTDISPVGADLDAQTEQQAEASRHAIHALLPETETVTDGAPRKTGWWSRRKSG